MITNANVRKAVQTTLSKAKRTQIKVFKAFRKLTGISITYAMNGKMKGMISLSTSPLVNAICAARQKVCGSVCAHCYAATMAKAYKNLGQMLIENGNVLADKVIPVEDWVRINPKAWKYFRLEAFGDVANAIQCINYFNLAERNPRVTFTAWTKNVELYETAVGMGHAKPKNLILIASSPELNEELDVSAHPIVDKVFTVFTKEWLKANDVRPQFINCGARSCLACGRCYTHNADGVAVEYVREILKTDTNAVHRNWVVLDYMDLRTAEKMLGHYLSMGKRWTKANPKVKHFYLPKRKPKKDEVVIAA